MKLTFKCRLPHGREGATYIGSAEISLKNGIRLTIDRSETHYSFSGNMLTMDWTGLLAKDGGKRLSVSDLNGLLDGSDTADVRFNICEGAPEDFVAEPVAMYCA